ncbi:uncharacterized protein LOC131932925 [Physella acuta]|uniref:uncharacterized protein LOC131932925 n=1 Tax=Physella acuta TaxID=109671 RepID=UPI0027DC7167|nr:uncharacterized protein LOC131932925 [Physella acuta]XP_059145809.1 uncharacterized protein LOC131932925 [Physella acuta]
MEVDVARCAASGPSLHACLTCHLCGEIFRRPRILPCGHTFCGECLLKLKDDQLGDGQKTEAVSVSSDVTDDPGHADSASVCSSRPGPPSDVDSLVGAEQLVNGMSRSQTFFREKRHQSCDRSPSRFSAPAGIGGSEKSCSKCGHVTSSTLPRRGKTSQSTPCIVSKSPKRQGSGGSSPRWSASPQRTSHLSPSSFDHKHVREMDLIVCPLPDCSYSLRVMNLARWSPKNNALADVISAWRRQRENLQDASTQTDISTDKSLLVTIPRTLVDSRALQPLGQRRRHSSMMDMALDSAISMDSLERGYIPRGHVTWRSYAAMVGMNILQQIVNL